MERLICQTLRCKGNRPRQVSIQHNRAWDIQPAVPAFQATGSSKPGEDSLPQPPYIVLDAAPIHGVPIEDLALRSVHLNGVQLAHRFRHLQSAAPHRLTRPTSAPFRAGQYARIRPVMRQPSGGGARSCGWRFPVAFRRVGVGFLGHPAPAGELHLPHGWPTGGHRRTPTGLSCCA